MLKAHPIRYLDAGVEYLCFGNPFPVTRAPATLAALTNRDAYESFTCREGPLDVWHVPEFTKGVGVAGYICQTSLAHRYRSGRAARFVFVTERGPRSVVESNERRASLVDKCRLLLRKSALTRRTFAERKATITRNNYPGAYQTWRATECWTMSHHLRVESASDLLDRFGVLPKLS